MADMLTKKPMFNPHDGNRYTVFAGSSQIISKDTRLWRYMSFEKFFWLIETANLYHARLDKLGDSFEGCVTEEYVRNRAAETESSQVIVNQMEPLINRTNVYTSFATCWHASPHESDAQWKIYGGSGAGIAVVSTISRLVNAVNVSSFPHAILGEVEYIDVKSHDMRRRPFGTLIRPGFAKRKSFEHEREVRGMILLNPVVDSHKFVWDEEFIRHQRSSLPDGVNAPVDVKELIEAIVVSPLAAPFMKDLVGIVARRHNLHELVRNSEMQGSPVHW